MTINKLFSPGDIEMFYKGNLTHGYRCFGAHLANEDGLEGVRFTLWAPNAKRVGVAGDFNNWNTENQMMQRINDSGIWSLFIPGLKEGDLYKYEIHTLNGEVFLKADPFAFYSEVRPQTASIIHSLDKYVWKDTEWQKKKNDQLSYNQPINIYEVHLGSWKRKQNGEFYSYREIAAELVNYAADMGYTHIELLPVMEHPFDGSWGYQITGFYSATSRYGNPEDFMYFIDYCHQKGLGVILDWVPAHFCKDAHGLARFDGYPLYEGSENYQWGTLSFDLFKPEVVSFLISNAIFWFDVYHVDGLRIDAVASMLYLDYGKKSDEWQPNKYGGKENLESVAFMKQLNEVVFKYFPNALMMAEESTDWPMVTRPTYLGGLGYNYKWNMGWMNDILSYMEMDPIYRKWHHSLANFSLMYAFSENYILPLSHDEVVHGKKSLIEKMPGDYWQKFANLRLLLAFMIGHPGKKLLFMGCEIAQFIEWRFYEEIDWQILKFPMHQDFHRYVKELNHFYLNENSLWERDYDWQGFKWIDADNSNQSILIFMRIDEKAGDFLIVVCNFTPVVYEKFRIGAPKAGYYQEVFNSDLSCYGGSGQKNPKYLKARKIPWHNQQYSLEMRIPPLATVFIKLKKFKGTVNR